MSSKARLPLRLLFLAVVASLPIWQVNAQSGQSGNSLLYLPIVSKMTWRPFNTTSPWNTPISANPELDPRSATMIAHFADPNFQDVKAWINVNREAPTMWVASPTDPVYDLICPPGSCLTLKNVPIPNNAVPDPSSDGTMFIINSTRTMEWDLYRGRRNANGTWSAEGGAAFDLTGNGVKPPDSHGGRGSGFALSAGIVTAEEVRMGYIPHALVIIIADAKPCYVWPAFLGGGYDDHPGAIPYGARLQLDPTLDLNSLGLPPAAKIIARALQEYGAYVGDQGSYGIGFIAESFYAKPVNYWAGVLTERDLLNLPANRFRVIRSGPETCWR